MIKRLEVKNLRGIKYIDLQLDNKPILLYAENGKGKSSIIDAIEWVLTGKISSLTGIQGVTFDKHAHHILSNSSQKQFVIEMDDNSILSTGLVPEINTKAAKLKEGMGHGLNILRRSQLLRSISAVPKERYELLRPFLPLDKITEIEAAAQTTIIKYESEKNSTLIKIRELALQIATHLDMDTKLEIKSKNIAETVNKICIEVELPIIADINKLDDLKSALEIETKFISNIENLGKSQTTILALKSLGSVSDILKLCNSLRLCFNIYVKERQKKDLLFNEIVLSLGAKWIKEGNLDKCPLCMNSIDTEPVLQDIKKRLDNEFEYIRIKTEYFNLVNEVKGNIELFSKVIKSLIVQSKDESDSELQCFVKEATEFVEGILSSDILKSPYTTNEYDIIENNAQLDVLCTDLIKKYQVVILSYGNTEKAIKISKLLNAITCIERNLPQINKFSSNYNKSDKALKFAFKWKETLENQRKIEVQAIYNSIKEQINYFYCKLHPRDIKCELVGGINLCVKDTGGGSALLQAGFHNKLAEDPRGYYSESHLDTLGLCIFLALYKKETDKNNSARLLVLDDVLTSVDAPHRKRVAELILSEFKEHQIIITTHDIVWCNDLIVIQRGIGNQFKVIKIDSWDIDQGPKFVDLKTNYDELLSLMDAAYSKSVISGSAGTLLEFLLNRLRYSLRLAIEARYDDKYTIGDIWPSFYSKVSAAGSKRILGPFYDSNKACIDDINLFWSVRNDNGCHYNEWAEGRSDEEIRDFARAVIELYKVVMCPSCGEVVGKISDKEFYCKCKNLNYSFYSK
ncbi:MAG: AAA family ATPase [Ruminiclostridium sp.]